MKQRRAMLKSQSNNNEDKTDVNKVGFEHFKLHPVVPVMQTPTCSR